MLKGFADPLEGERKKARAEERADAGVGAEERKQAGAEERAYAGLGAEERATAGNVALEGG